MRFNRQHWHGVGPVELWGTEELETHWLKLYGNWKIRIWYYPISMIDSALFSNDQHYMFHAISLDVSKVYLFITSQLSIIHDLSLYLVWVKNCPCRGDFFISKITKADGEREGGRGRGSEWMCIKEWPRDRSFLTNTNT